MKVTNLIAGFVLIASVSTAHAAPINYTTSGNVINENFDSLASAGTNVVWANDSTLPAWSLFNVTGAAITTYNTGTGSSGTGNFYSFGATAAVERALGGVASSGAYFGAPASGTIAGWIAVAINNNTGAALSDFTVGFNGEQWRNGGNASLAAQTMVLEYGFGATFATVGTWTAPGGNFDWTTVVNSPAAGAAVDGNAAGLVTGKGGTVSSLTWNNGDTLWIRWVERNDVGNDHGMAIDTFSISATPEPATVGLLAIGVLGLVRRRR